MLLIQSAIDAKFVVTRACTNCKDSSDVPYHPQITIDGICMASKNLAMPY
jgi:hypothetical protein